MNGNFLEVLILGIKKKTNGVLWESWTKPLLSVLKAKPDLNTTLPVRQTASIFKQPVTKITNHPNNKVKTDPQKAADQPKQVSLFDKFLSKVHFYVLCGWKFVCFKDVIFLTIVFNISNCACEPNETNSFCLFRSRFDAWVSKSKLLVIIPSNQNLACRCSLFFPQIMLTCAESLHGQGCPLSLSWRSAEITVAFSPCF